MSDLDTNCVTIETFTQVIADECLDNLILGAINTIKKNKNPPDAFSISEFMYEELKNPDLTTGIIEQRLSSLTKNNKIENKSTNGKCSPVLPSATDKSLPLPVKL